MNIRYFRKLHYFVLHLECCFSFGCSIKLNVCCSFSDLAHAAFDLFEMLHLGVASCHNWSLTDA